MTADVRRVLITGSRTWTHTGAIRAALAAVWAPDVVLVTGGCPRGADFLAEQCWTRWGGVVERHPADWAAHGRAAGFRRNQHMVDLGADVCLAFIHECSRCATHCVEAARRAGIPVRLQREDTIERGAQP
ncbi:SLOG family protein [Actinokineospora sp. HUAS TT18]|uniref:SLOG family protein n=1 Tax=Actinokineospora sp. HUAS TT18 TaxID=3447451 RepID=UPI003F525B5D